MITFVANFTLQISCQLIWFSIINQSRATLLLTSLKIWRTEWVIGSITLSYLFGLGLILVSIQFSLSILAELFWRLLRIICHFLVNCISKMALLFLVFLILGCLWFIILLKVLYLRSVGFCEEEECTIRISLVFKPNFKKYW